MRLDTTLPAPHGRDPQVRAAPAAGADFARAITSRRPGDTPRATEAIAFATLVRIGDDAVRFDARPIVAPTAEAASAAEPMTGADRLALAIRHEPGPAALPANRSDVVADALRAAVARLGDARATVVAGTVDAAPIAAGADGHALPASLPGPTRGPGKGTARLATAPTPLTPRPAAPDRPVGVRIVILADEVRVLLRAALLTGADRTELARVARETLADTPLAGRPVRLIETRGRG